MKIAFEPIGKGIKVGQGSVMMSLARDWGATAPTDMSSNYLNAIPSIPFRAVNGLQQLLNPSRKIFVIGYNKCGTRSLHILFKRNGIRSAHWGGHDPTRNLAAIMKRNIDQQKSVLNRLESYTAFSDLSFYSDQTWVEGCRFYKQMFTEYPESYFILNTRPIESWIQSRLKHGDFRQRATLSRGCEVGDLPAIWRREFIDHHNEVLSFFQHKPDSLCVFDIEEDRIGKVIDFLWPVFWISDRYWEHRGKTDDS